MEPHQIPRLPKGYRLIRYRDSHDEDSTLIVELQHMVAMIWQPVGRRIAPDHHGASEDSETAHRLAIELIAEYGIPEPRELERRAKHKLAVLRHVDEISGNVAATCRYYGISRQAYYKWKRRYEEEGLEGLKDCSSQPYHQPNKTDPKVIEKILWLRQQYHFGPHKVAMYLTRYHDIAISPSAVWRILKKVGLNRLPASQRYKRTQTCWKRYEKQRPGHALHVKIRPRTPRLNGKVERSHRIDSDEFYRLLEGEVIDDANLFAARLQQWEDHYNYDRPHGALGGKNLSRKHETHCHRPPSVAHLVLCRRPTAPTRAGCAP